MDLSYNEDKEKRRRLTGEKTIRCCGQGENMEKYGFGVDVGGTSCKLGLFTDSGKLMEKWEIPTDTSEQGEHIIEHVAASLERRQRERGLADEQIIGVGIDTPGIVGRDGVVRGAVNLGWEACPIFSMEVTPIPSASSSCTITEKLNFSLCSGNSSSLVHVSSSAKSRSSRNVFKYVSCVFSALPVPPS